MKQSILTIKMMYTSIIRVNVKPALWSNTYIFAELENISKVTVFDKTAAVFLVFFEGRGVNIYLNQRPVFVKKILTSK